MMSSFSPLILVLFLTSFCLQLSHLWLLLLPVTLISTYYVPFLEWIYGWLRSICLNYWDRSDINVLSSTSTSTEDLEEEETAAGATDMPTEFSLTLDLRCTFWFLFIRLPLSFFHHYSSPDLTFTTITILLFFFPFIFLPSLFLSFISFNLSVGVKLNRLRMMQANFSPLISVLFFSSFFLELTYFSILLLLVTFTSTYYVPLLDWIHRRLRSIFLNINVWSSTNMEEETAAATDMEHQSTEIAIDIQEEDTVAG